jgi:predicted MPP superfamily phosphohydrolase
LISLISLLLFGVPWLGLVATVGWPVPVKLVATLLLVVALAALPNLMAWGHGRRQADRAARLGDTLLGVAWVLFTWTVLGQVVRLALLLFGLAGPGAGRETAVAVLVVVVVLVALGCLEALRLPRVRRQEVTIPGLGAELDGLRVVVITDTHFGPIDRTAWAARLVTLVNGLCPDVVCHTGDLADGTVARRKGQVAALAGVRAEHGRFYITGNHEYFGEPQAWLDHMQSLGWVPLHNASRVVQRGAHRLVFAGIDDPTGTRSGLPGHGPDLATALAGVAPASPVVLLAHQPRQVTEAVRAGVHLQISGHTHGGQIWPFHYLVRTEQPVLSGLSQHGDHTQLYTSRGTGFWGPPLRIFAPSEVTLITLRASGTPT